MLDRIKRIICHPITIIVFLLLAVGSVITFAIVKNVNQEKADLISKVDIAAITKDKDSGKLVALVVDDKLEQQTRLDIVNAEFDKVTNPEKTITDTIDGYINKRYNFSNGASSFDDATKQAIKSYTTDSFYQTVIDSLTKDKTASSQATIVKRFINGRNQDVTDINVERLGYIYVVNINGTQKAIKFELLGEKGEWKINSETIISDVEGGKLW